MAKVEVKRIRERANQINSGWKQDAAAGSVKFRKVLQTEYEAKIEACAAKDAEYEAAVARQKHRRRARRYVSEFESDIG